VPGFPHPADAVTPPTAPPLAARNVGHGHVFARPDGRRARCGGPALCRECSPDAAMLAAREADVRGEQAVAVGRLRALADLLRAGEPVRRGLVLEHLDLALADLDPPTPAPDEAPPVRDEALHGRACGIHAHAHGATCAADCPTCGGRPL
jgi:hypothetical protein